MENHHQPVMATGQPKKGIGKKGFLIKALGFGIIAIACGILWFMYTEGQKSRPSTPSEIAAQEKFQKELIKSQEDFQKKMDAVVKEAEQTGMQPNEEKLNQTH